MRSQEIAFAVTGGLLVLALGCSAAPTNPSAVATARPTTAAAPTTAATPTGAAAPIQAPTPIQAHAAPTTAPTPTVPAPPLQITLDGQPLTADSLPSPQTYYTQLLATHGKDLSSCQASPTPQPGSCPKPTSLGAIDLKQQINVELILDDSGSMAETVGGGRKIDIAKRVLTDFIGTLPHSANVALRVFGHKGSNADADKAVSCQASEVLYPFQPLDAAKFQQAIAGFEPTGWTPLAMSFERAEQDFSQFDPATSSNFVYVVTDGIETCDGDPVAAAQALHAANVQPIVNIVGFDVDQQAADQLKQAAESGGGQFYTAQNADDLSTIFQSNFNWQEWTEYYNCRYGAAMTQFNTVAASQTDSFNCFAGGITEEFNAVAEDATERFNRIAETATSSLNDYDAAHLSDDAAVHAAHDQYNALMQRATENHDYAIQQESARHDAIMNASTAQHQQVMSGAQAQYRQAIQEVHAEQTQTPPH